MVLQLGAYGDDVLTSLLRTAVQDIRVETAYGPTIDIPDPFAPAQPNPFLQAMKPTITFNPDAAAPVQIAPYGPSHGEKWPAVEVGSLILFGIAGLTVLKWLSSKRRS